MKVPLEFTRLSGINPATIAHHMSDPRMRAHMPLLEGPWTVEQAEAFVRGKEERWAQDGLGHWAFLQGSTYVGWGCFEKEGDAWDFALVLRPKAFGLGPRIARKAFAFAQSDERIGTVVFQLAPTRRSVRALERLGAKPAGESQVGGETFMKFRLDTPSLPT